MDGFGVKWRGYPTISLDLYQTVENSRPPAFKAFLIAGFVKVRQRGSYIRLEKIEGNDIIKLTVPLRNPIKKGTLSRIPEAIRAFYGT